MNKRYFLELAGYIGWADSIAIEWLNEITDEQWEQAITSSFSTIKQTATHIVSAEKIWIDYWKIVPNPVFLSTTFKGSKDELIDIWKRTSAELKNFIEQYSEEDYMRQVNFKWPNGKVGKMEFWQTFSHFMNHSTYHRGQLVTMLRQAGFTKLSSTDLASYYRIIS